MIQLSRPYPENVYLESEGDSTRTEFSLAVDYPYFDGHFPGKPIVPAVTQVGWILEAIGAWTGATVERYRLSRFKFSAMIEPGKIVRLELEKRGEKYSCRLFVDDVACSSGTVILTQ